MELREEEILNGFGLSFGISFLINSVHVDPSMVFILMLWAHPSQMKYEFTPTFPLSHFDYSCHYTYKFPVLTARFVRFLKFLTSWANKVLLILIYLWLHLKVALKSLSFSHLIITIKCGE